MKFFKLKLILFFSGLLLMPKLALAATAYLTPDFESVSVGDTVIVNVMMDPAGQRPNVIEGNIAIESGAGKITISKLSIAGSVLTFWAQNPSLDQASLISFTGGTPGGFSQSSALLFKIAFVAKEEGQVVFGPANFKAYKNDGQGTPIDVSTRPLTLTIGPAGDQPSQDQWLEIIARDDQPPQDLTATIGQDGSVFGGKKFITIHAVDNQSGIDYYQVTEGDWQAVRTGNTYVLLDQSQSKIITVAVYDKAGNYSQIILTPDHAKIIIWRMIIALVVFLGLSFMVFKFVKSIKKNKNKIRREKSKN